MHISRRNLSLAGVLVLLFLADSLLAPDHRPVRSVGPLLAQLDVQQADRIELRGPDAAALVLQRKGEGWVLPGSLSYPARAELVRTLLDSLASLSTLDLVSSDGTKHDEYGVGSGTHLRVLDGEGLVLGELVQGDLAPDGSATFGRLPAGDETYRLSGLLGFRLDAAYYLDARLLSFEPALVAAVRVQTPAGVVGLLRDPARVNTWRREESGQPVAATRVERLLTNLRATFLSEVLSDEPTADLTRFSVELEMTQGEQIHFSFGETNGEGTVPAVVGGAGFTVGISPASARALLSAIQDF